MISKQKKIVYGLVLVGSIGMLVTQIFARGKPETTPAPLEVPAEGGSAPRPALAASSSITLAGDGSDIAAPSTSGSNEKATDAGGDADRDAGGVDGALTKLERALGTLRNFQPNALRPALDQLVQPPAPPSTPEHEQPFANAQVELPDIELPRLEELERSSRPPPLEQLRALLEEQPLCGILRGASDSAAMFGGRIVRVGDQLVPGDAVVRAIEAKAVVVAFQGNELRIELPPFRPRPSSKSSDDESVSDEKPSAEPTEKRGSGASAGASSASSPELKDVIDAIKQDS